jgi:hypothetical protein
LSATGHFDQGMLQAWIYGQLKRKPQKNFQTNIATVLLFGQTLRIGTNQEHIPGFVIISVAAKMLEKYRMSHTIFFNADLIKRQSYLCRAK